MSESQGCESLLDTQSCGHPKSYETSADSYTFCSVCAVRPRATPSDVLLRAADLLTEFGWRQMHVGSKRQGAFCAYGATNEAARDLVAPREVWQEARRRLRDAVGRSVAHWNDDPARTKAEVVSKLREAASV